MVVGARQKRAEGNGGKISKAQDQRTVDEPKVSTEDVSWFFSTEAKDLSLNIISCSLPLLAMNSS